MKRESHDEFRQSSLDELDQTDSAGRSDGVLPMGSIVYVNHGSTRLMIVGRLMKTVIEDPHHPGQMIEKVYDYGAFVYPYGQVEDGKMMLFNHSEIREIVFYGYQDEEESRFVQDIQAYKREELNHERG